MCGWMFGGAVEGRANERHSKSWNHTLFPGESPVDETVLSSVTIRITEDKLF